MIYIMADITLKKVKLEQKKSRLIMEEVKLKIQERKHRTRHLIELGGLIVKAQLDSLDSNTLYGALLFLKSSMHGNEQIIKSWTQAGSGAFESEEKTRQPVILTFPAVPELKIRDLIRQHGLRWNALRQEWAGYVTEMQSLKDTLSDMPHKFELIKQTALLEAGE